MSEGGGRGQAHRGAGWQRVGTPRGGASWRAGRAGGRAGWRASVRAGKRAGGRESGRAEESGRAGMCIGMCLLIHSAMHPVHPLPVALADDPMDILLRTAPPPASIVGEGD